MRSLADSFYALIEQRVMLADMPEGQPKRTKWVACVTAEELFARRLEQVEGEAQRYRRISKAASCAY